MKKQLLFLAMFLVGLVPVFASNFTDQFGEVLLTIVMIGVMIVIVAVIVGSELLVGHFSKLPAWVRWLLFLPVSVARTLLLVLVFYIGTAYVLSLSEIAQRIVGWVVYPLLLFYTIFRTIPRAKKPVTIILSALWLVSGVWELIFLSTEDFVPRIIQCVALALFIFFVASNRISPKSISEKSRERIRMIEELEAEAREESGEISSPPKKEQPKRGVPQRTAVILLKILKALGVVVTLVGGLGMLVFWFDAMSEWVGGFIAYVIALVSALAIVAFPLIYWLVERHVPVIYFVFFGIMWGGVLLTGLFGYLLDKLGEE